MRVSIVIPTYERPDFLDRLLSSIAKQTFTDYEVIVVDDASKQKNEYQEVVSKYENVNYLRNDKNLGAPLCRNLGIQLAKADLVALVDDDDEWLPQKLEKQIEYLDQSSKNIGIVYTWAEARKEGRVLYRFQADWEGEVLPRLLMECFIPSSSVLVKKKALLQAGLFDPMMPSCQDWDMWTRILALGYDLGVVKSFETIYHKHDRKTIGGSVNAKKGYALFYDKHMPLYKKHWKLFYWKRRLKKILKSWL